MSNNSSVPVVHRSLSIKGFTTTFLRYWKILIPIVLICFFIFTFYSAFIATPMYRSTAKLYIVNKTSTQVTPTDFNISTYLAHDFAEILSDQVVLSEVAEELDGKYSVTQLSNYLTVTATEETRIIEIKVASPDPHDSKLIADTICKVAEHKLVDIMGLDRVKIIRNGSFSKKPFTPNTTLDALKGLCVGIFISTTVAFFIMITNNKISSSDDVEQILGLTILTTIPFTDRKKAKR